MNEQVQDFTETQYKAIPGQISTNESQGIVECFVAGIGNKDSVGDICLPGCFNGSLKRRKPRVVWGHNWNEPIGKVLEIYEVGPNDPRLPAKMKANGIGGLFAKVQFNLKSERGREAFSNVQFFGEEQEWSIGYKTLDAVFDTSKQANMLKEVELYEVSPVLHGANQLTGTISIKSDKPLKDPKGGLTAAGRAHFRRTEGANLKPGVKGPANTPMKMRRKGSFLTRFFTNPSGPMKDEKGRPTRLALSAAAWGEPVPKNMEDAARLAAKGRRLLERYENSKKSDDMHDEIDEKNVQIYSISNASQNPIIGRMGNLAKALSNHFGGEVAVREADNNVVVFDISKDGKSETMRVSYHTPNESEFMFGSAQPVRVETIYLPLDSDGTPSGAPIPSSPNMISEKPKGGCGCGGACGMKSSPFNTWEEFKNDTPGIHMFVKTANMEMYEVANDIAEYHGFDVELLEDGFTIPNIDWYEEDARKALLSAIDSIEQKAFGRLARVPLSAGRRARAMVKPSTFDGDGDGFLTGRDGRDNIPAPRKPNVNAPRMMPPRREPTEVPERERRPSVVPRTIPRPQPQPAPTPAPARPRTPARPARPGAISGRMSIEPKRALRDPKTAVFDKRAIDPYSRKPGMWIFPDGEEVSPELFKRAFTKKNMSRNPEKAGFDGYDSGNYIFNDEPYLEMSPEVFELLFPESDSPAIAELNRLKKRADSMLNRRQDSQSGDGETKKEAKERAQRELEMARSLDEALSRAKKDNAIKDWDITRITETINLLSEPAESAFGPLASEESKRKTILRQLREMEMDPSSPSGAPTRARENAIKMIAKRNNMTEAQVRRALRRAIAAERMTRAAKRMTGMKKSAAGVYMSLPESADIEVKGLSSIGANYVLIPVEKPFLLEVKQFVDGVAEFYNLRIKAVEEGIQIFNTDTLDDSAIEAASNAIHAAFLQVSVEEAEISKALGIKYS